MRPLEPLDKAKTCSDILIDARINVRNYIASPMEPKRILHEVLYCYKITERQLFKLRHIKAKRVYMFLLYEACFLDYGEIADKAKCHNELEVILGIEKIKVAMRKDRSLLANVGGIVDKLLKNSYEARTTIR